MLDACEAVKIAEAKTNVLKSDLDQAEREAVGRAAMSAEREASAVKRVHVAEENLLKAEIDVQKTKEEVGPNIL